MSAFVNGGATQRKHIQSAHKPGTQQLMICTHSASQAPACKQCPISSSHANQTVTARSSISKLAGKSHEHPGKQTRSPFLTRTVLSCHHGMQRQQMMCNGVLKESLLLASITLQHARSTQYHRLNEICPHAYQKQAASEAHIWSFTRSRKTRLVFQDRYGRETNNKATKTSRPLWLMHQF
jgi:hypothetical protein